MADTLHYNRLAVERYPRRRTEGRAWPSGRSDVTQKITLLDYGMCNMLNVARALEHAGADVHVTEDPKDAVAAERLVVPGVGAFSECMRAVNRSRPWRCDP